MNGRVRASSGKILLYAVALLLAPSASRAVTSDPTDGGGEVVDFASDDGASITDDFMPAETHTDFDDPWGGSDTEGDLWGGGQVAEDWGSPAPTPMPIDYEPVLFEPASYEPATLEPTSLVSDSEPAAFEELDTWGGDTTYSPDLESDELVAAYSDTGASGDGWLWTEDGRGEGLTAADAEGLLAWGGLGNGPSAAEAAKQVAHDAIYGDPAMVAYTKSMDMMETIADGLTGGRDAGRTAKARAEEFISKHITGRKPLHRPIDDLRDFVADPPKSATPQEVDFVRLKVLDQELAEHQQAIESYERELKRNASRVDFDYWLSHGEGKEMMDGYKASIRGFQDRFLRRKEVETRLIDHVRGLSGQGKPQS